MNGAVVPKFIKLRKLKVRRKVENGLKSVGR